MSITAAEVKALREKTGAGMMDCKNALVKAEGDSVKAEKILKEMGLLAVSKRSGRATNEGKVFSLIRGGKGVLLELSCETDFVALNDDFSVWWKLSLTKAKRVRTRSSAPWSKT